MKISHKDELLYAKQDILLHEEILKTLNNTTVAERKKDRSIPFLIQVYTNILKERKQDLQKLERC